jgi:LCP family protein required for cell wall assembly
MPLQCIVSTLVAPATPPPGPPTRPSPSARRSALAGFLGLLVPGLGHAVVGRYRTAAIFLTPLLLLAAAALGTYAGGGLTALLAFAVTPGVLPALAILNIALAAWRIAAGIDASRFTPNRAVVAAVLTPAILALVVVPQLWVNTTIHAADDFLNSAFATDNGPEATEEPDETSHPDWTLPPDDEADASAEPSASPDGLGTPGPTDTPKPSRAPGTAGIGNLPGLNVAVPWARPGAVPWGDDGRFDLLLLGSDAGPYRWSRRMDVMLLVEVDVATGKTAMIGLPRNLINAPLPPGPARSAVACGCFTDLLNALYVEATVRHPERWPGSGAVEGIGAVRSVVSELTGRPIDAVLVADLWGVIKVVDAMGGVDVDVPTRLYDTAYPDPVYGKMTLDISAGHHHFDGRTALAYARSRHSSSDYARMARQQTLLLAIREDIGPSTILDAPDLFSAAKGFTWTDLPRSSLPNLVTLFGKAANASVKQLRIVPPTYAEWMTPAEIQRIRTDIAKLLGVPVPPPLATAAPSATPAPSPTPSPPATPTTAPTATPEPSAPESPAPS